MNSKLGVPPANSPCSTFANNPNELQLQPVPAQVTVPLTMIKPLVGPDSTTIDCPYCRSSIKTSLVHTTTTRTHTIAIRCCIFCCCCIPYCCNSAKNTDHYCPGCKKFIGTYEK